MVLRYGGLSATDASGRALPSRLVLERGQLLLRVDARGARFPLRVDPMAETETPEQQLLPPAGEEGEAAGMSVALSRDGSTALVGAPAGASGGGVWVFTRSGSTWTEQTQLHVPSGAETCAEGSGGGEETEDCRFGRTVALSADGDTAAIGAPLANSEEGAAWIFTRAGSTWTQTGELKSPEPVAAGHFGRSVSLSDDGEEALVGAPGEAGGHGRAWVFTSSGSSWPATGAPLTGAGEGGVGYFGRSVALSGDGEVALVGAPADDGSVGAAWVYARSESRWLEQGWKLTGSGEVAEGRFGAAVALSEDGSTALIGAHNDGGANAEAEDTGAAWVFAQTGSTWSEQSPKLTGAGEDREQFGYSVALSASGDDAIIGAPHADEAHGTAWVYQRSEGTWGALVNRLSADLEEQGRAHFGSSVAISADGSTELVGSPDDDGEGGAAWAFDEGPSITKVSPPSGSTAGGDRVEIEGEHLGETLSLHFGENEATSFRVLSEKLIEAVTPPGTGVVDVVVETPFGASQANALDQFEYTPAGHKTGGGHGGEGEGEDETKKGKGSEEPNGTPQEGTSVTGNQSASVAVLAIGPSASAPCGASLLSTKIAVQPRSRALFKLLGTGTGRCAGKLRLRVRLKLANKRFKLKTIGTAIFSIGAGERVSVEVKLNAAGRRLLRAGHGRLNASLLLVKQSPVPFVSRTASVRLARQRSKPKPSPTLG